MSIYCVSKCRNSSLCFFYHRNDFFHLPSIWSKCVGSSNLTFKIKDNDLNEQIERISKLIYFVQVKLTVAAVIFPAMLITLVNYFVFNKNDQSYSLPIPIMYVQNEMYLIFIKPSGDGKIIVFCGCVSKVTIWLANTIGLFNGYNFRVHLNVWHCFKYRAVRMFWNRCMCLGQ